MAKPLKVRVKFKRTFISPEGVRMRVSDNPHTVPKDWTLPKDAEVLGEVAEEDEPAKVEKAKPVQPNPPKVDLVPAKKD